MKDYYEILGVPRSATDDEIKKAFRTLAQKYHPDKKGGDEAKFKEASEAYAVLGDKKRRAEYDTYGKTFAGGGPGQFGGFDFSNFQNMNGQAFEFDLGDIFGEFFGGQSPFSGRAEPRGRDVSIDIELTFKESIFGTERKVLIAKVGVCDTCRGTGAKQGTAMVTCSTCNGKGELRENRNTIFGSISTSRLCPRCHGKGEVPEQPCPTCRGEGVARRQEEISISVPAGVSDGEMIRMPGRGEATAGGVTGDFYVKLHVKAAQNFIREGNQLLTVLPIKLSDALLGGEYRVKTLEGETALKIPAGIKHGETLRIKGEGVPYGRSSRGDLVVRVDVLLPQKLSAKARELIERLRSEGL